jgi:8-oxo-dGDP phosphatase
MDIRQVATRTVYRNPWMTVREDDVERADGSPGVFGVVEKDDFALVIPFDGDHVHLVEQYRYPVRARSWEFPQGSVDGADAGPEDAARRELAEETGLTAERMRHLGRLHEAHGYSTQAFDVWVATGLTAGPTRRSREEQDMCCDRFTVTRFEDMIRTGAITDAPTVAAWALMGLHTR